MTRVQPGFSLKALLHLDLGKALASVLPGGRIPGFGLSKDQYGEQARRGKEILFAELALAIRGRVPEAKALELLASRVGDHLHTPTFRAQPPPLTLMELALGRRRTVQPGESLAPLAWLFVLLIAPIFLLTRFTPKGDAVARSLALRLLGHVRLGQSLGEAMRRTGRFTPEEVAMMQAGEELGRPAEALEALAGLQRSVATPGSMVPTMAYPAVLFVLATVVGSFLLLNVAPKFIDIFRQLSSYSYPSEPESLMAFVYSSQYAPHFLGTLIFVLVAGALRGPRRATGVGVIVLVASLICRNVDLAITGTALGPMTVFALPLIGLLTLMSPGAAFTGFLFNTFERIPLLGAPLRLAREGNWMAGLSLGIGAGVAAPEAVRQAGRIAGGRFIRGSETVAALVAGGHTLGHALLRTGLLPRPTTERIALLESAQELPVGLSCLARDTQEDAQHRARRMSIFAVQASHILVGILICLIVFAFYKALFDIPSLVILSTEARR